MPRRGPRLQARRSANAARCLRACHRSRTAAAAGAQRLASGAPACPGIYGNALRVEGRWVDYSLNTLARRYRIDSGRAKRHKGRPGFRQRGAVGAESSCAGFFPPPSIQRGRDSRVAPLQSFQCGISPERIGVVLRAGTTAASGAAANSPTTRALLPPSRPSAASQGPARWARPSSGSSLLLIRVAGAARGWSLLVEGMSRG